MHEAVRASTLWQLVLRRMDGIEPVFANDLSRYMVGIGNSLNVYFSASHLGADGTPWVQVVAPLSEMSTSSPPSPSTMKTLLGLGLVIAQRYANFGLGLDAPLNAAVLLWEHPSNLAAHETERLFDDFLDAASVTQSLMENAETESFGSQRSLMSARSPSYGNDFPMNASLLSILDQAPKA